MAKHKAFISGDKAIAQHEDQTNTAYANMTLVPRSITARDLTSSMFNQAQTALINFAIELAYKALDKSHQVTNATAWRQIEAFQSAVLPKESNNSLMAQIHTVTTSNP